VDQISAFGGFFLSTVYRVLSTGIPSLLATLFCLSGIRRSIVDRNLALTLGHPQNSLFFRWKLAFHLFQDLQSLVFGPPALPRLSTRSRVHLESLRAGPTLLLAAHFHNWEAQASALNRLGVPLLGAARLLAFSPADALLRRLRTRNRVPVVVRDVPRAALRHLRSGGCFGFLWDQHSPESTRSGTFFGCSVSLNPLPFSLLKNEPCPVYCGVWLPGNELRFILLSSRFDGDWQGRLERRYHRVLETLIRRHPQYWYGFLHARFKTLGPYPGHRESVGSWGLGVGRKHKTNSKSET
jgi:lauroyl/myristoyl acyltransferase